MINKLKDFIEKPFFVKCILSLIIFNSIILGLKTYPDLMKQYWLILDVLDDIIVFIFVCELLLYLLVKGVKDCFTDPWYLFDAAVILVAVVSFEPAFSSLRAMRVLRVLRLVTMFPHLRKVIQGLIASIPGITSIGMLLMIVLYVFALISTNLYGEAFPKYFGSLQGSLFSLFQIMTAESWASNIARPVMEVYPYAWIFFVLFILATSFIVLNLFIAVIVDAMQKDVDYKAGEEEKLEDLNEIKMIVKKIDQKLN